MKANFGIIGNGDIASCLPKDTDKLFFAAGVSNSGETDEAEYKRELNLLMEQPRSSHLVYFSSLSIFYSKTRYARHKRWMEMMIKKHFPKYCIIRVGNIDWGTNPHTLINYLRSHPDAEIRDEWRYIINKAELLYWVGLIPDWSVELNIPGRRLKVQQIKEEYV